jgi:preprotein translocase subunit Sss1
MLLLYIMSFQLYLQTLAIPGGGTVMMESIGNLWIAIGACYCFLAVVTAAIAYFEEGRNELKEMYKAFLEQRRTILFVVCVTHAMFLAMMGLVGFAVRLLVDVDKLRAEEALAQNK